MLFVETAKEQVFHSNVSSSRGLRARSLVPQPTKLPVTGRGNVPAKPRGECTWVFVTAGGPHEEFLGSSWPLESSPLTAAPCGAKIRKMDRPPVVSRLDW